MVILNPRPKVFSPTSHLYLLPQPGLEKAIQTYCHPDDQITNSTIARMAKIVPSWSDTKKSPA